jgi:excisionase family DNA binding protein
MIQIIQLNAEDLRAEIKNCIIESIEELKTVPLNRDEDLPDRCYMEEACKITGFSESKIYKETMKRTIPFEKYGKRLVFSRKKLFDWMESRTKRSPGIAMAENMAKKLNRRASL